MLVSALGKESEHSAGGCQSVRSSCEAGNDRGAKGTQEGGSMTDRTTDQEPKRVPARAYRRRNQPGAIDLVGTESLDVMLGDEAKSRSLSTEHPPTGKPDAGEPPVRFGGRGRSSALPTPIGRRDACRYIIYFTAGWVMIRSPRLASSVARPPTGSVALKRAWPKGRPVTTGTFSGHIRSLSTSANVW